MMCMKKRREIFVRLTIPRQIIAIITFLVSGHGAIAAHGDARSTFLVKHVPKIALALAIEAAESIAVTGRPRVTRHAALVSKELQPTGLGTAPGACFGGACSLGTRGCVAVPFVMLNCAG